MTRTGFWYRVDRWSLISGPRLVWGGRYSIACHHSDSPDAEAVAGEVAGMLADARICWSQSMSKECERGGPVWNRNKGPGTSTLRARYDITKWTAQSRGQSRPMWIKVPFLNGSVFEALIFKCMHEGADGESTAMSWTPKWFEGGKVARLGTVNSEARRKPKYPREQAAQNMRWSGRRRSKDRQITNVKSSVIGKQEEDVEPWERLIPQTTLWRWRQLARGSGNPCSMWSALIPDK